MCHLTSIRHLLLSCFTFIRSLNIQTTYTWLIKCSSHCFTIFVIQLCPYDFLSSCQLLFIYLFITTRFAMYLAFYNMAKQNRLNHVHAEMFLFGAIK